MFNIYSPIWITKGNPNPRLQQRSFCPSKDTTHNTYRKALATNAGLVDNKSSKTQNSTVSSCIPYNLSRWTMICYSSSHDHGVRIDKYHKWSQFSVVGMIKSASFRSSWSLEDHYRQDHHCQHHASLHRALEKVGFLIAKLFLVSCLEQRCHKILEAL